MHPVTRDLNCRSESICHPIVCKCDVYGVKTACTVARVRGCGCTQMDERLPKFEVRGRYSAVQRCVEFNQLVVVAGACND